MKSRIEKVQFIRSTLGSTRVARDGVNVAVKCPSCGEKKGKFSINIDNWMCHCWVCGTKSKSLYFILKKHCDNNASSQFLKNFGLPKGSKETVSDNFDIVSIPEGFTLLASYRGKDPDMRAIIQYCRRRGLSERDLWYFRVGGSSDRSLRRRVIIPSFDADGELNFFVSRAIDKNGFPKYANSKAKKTEIIFNEMNIDWSKEVTIVEGPFDLMKTGENSTCLLGSKLSKSGKLFSKIVENKSPVLLALDQDMKMESYKIARLLSSYGVDVRIFKNTSNTDVGGMSKESFIKMSKHSLEWSEDSILKFKISSIKSGSLF